MSGDLRLFVIRGGKVYAIRNEPLAAGLGGVFPEDRRARVFLFEVKPPELIGAFESEAEARRFIESTEARNGK